MPCSSPLALHDPGPPADCRCLCGSLLARLVAAGVELKCRRCKRTLVVPLEVDSARTRAAAPSAARTPAEHR